MAQANAYGMQRVFALSELRSREIWNSIIIYEARAHQILTIHFAGEKNVYGCVM